MARMCAQSEQEFELAYGSKIESINYWFSNKFPDTKTVEEDPIVVPGVRCRQVVGFHYVDVFEDRFKSETEDLLDAIKQAEAA